jgi:phosphoribosylaminoimidazole-succinocarboxamide synthase
MPSNHISPAAPLLAQGKIRDLFAVDEETVLVVASDRISAFDAVLGTEIPEKGAVLTAMSLWWFDQVWIYSCFCG